MSFLTCLPDLRTGGCRGLIFASALSRRTNRGLGIDPSMSYFAAATAAPGI
jgi:hypothetical protein